MNNEVPNRAEMISTETVLNSDKISEYLSEESLASYKKDLDTWVSEFGMGLYMGSVDHFAVKVENEEKFEEMVLALKPYCIDKQGETPGLSIRKMHGRRIAVALLKTPIKFGDNLVSCIELMQPRPESQGTDVVGFDHAEIVTSNLEEIETVLKGTGSNYYVDETNPYKEIVVSFVNSHKERIKFTNKTLAEIVPLQMTDEPERVEIIPT